MSNPVHRHDGKWWHWDEVGVDRVGPYKTKEDAHKALVEYAKYLDEHNPDGTPREVK